MRAAPTSLFPDGAPPGPAAGQSLPCSHCKATPECTGHPLTHRVLGRPKPSRAMSSAQPFCPCCSLPSWVTRQAWGHVPQGQGFHGPPMAGRTAAHKLLKCFKKSYSLSQLLKVKKSPAEKPENDYGKQRPFPSWRVLKANTSEALTEAMVQREKQPPAGTHLSACPQYHGTATSPVTVYLSVLCPGMYSLSSFSLLVFLYGNSAQCLTFKKC